MKHTFITAVLMCFVIYVSEIILKFFLKKCFRSTVVPFGTCCVVATSLLSSASLGKTKRKMHAGSNAFTLLPVPSVIVVQLRPAGKAFVLLTAQHVKD